MKEVVFSRGVSAVATKDFNGWQWHATARRIPRHAAQDMQDMATLVVEANAVLASAQTEAGQIRRDAFDEGIRVSQDCIAELLAETLIVAQDKVANYLKMSEPRIVKLVFVVLRRLLPQLSADAVIECLVMDALRSLHDKNYVRVHVHPNLHEAAQELLPGWRATVPDIGHLEVCADESLTLTACRVECAFGSVTADLQDRFERLVSSYEAELHRQESAEHG